MLKELLSYSLLLNYPNKMVSSFSLGERAWRNNYKHSFPYLIKKKQENILKFFKK